MFVTNLLALFYLSVNTFRPGKMYLASVMSRIVIYDIARIHQDTFSRSGVIE